MLRFESVRLLVSHRYIVNLINLQWSYCNNWNIISRIWKTILAAARANINEKQVYTNKHENPVVSSSEVARWSASLYQLYGWNLRSETIHPRINSMNSRTKPSDFKCNNTVLLFYVPSERVKILQQAQTKNLKLFYDI